MKVDLYNKNGQRTGEVELDDNVFAVKLNDDAMQKDVVAYLAHQRQGTHKTKTRKDVRGGGKKPWRQKGRGTARAGSIRSPLWAGGGTIHGPQPHKYLIKLHRKLKVLARKSALSLRCSENNLCVLEDFTFEEIKTRQMAEVLRNFNFQEDSTLLLIPEIDNKIYLSSRNIPRLSVYPADKVSTYDILKHRKIMIFKSAVDRLVEILS